MRPPAALLLLCTPFLAVGADAPKRVLVCTTTAGYRHESIPFGEEALAALDKASPEFEIVGWLRQPEVVVPQAPTAPRPPADGSPSEAVSAYLTAREVYQKDVEAWNRDLKPEADRKRAEFDAAISATLQALSPEAMRKNHIDAVVFCNTSGTLPLPDLQGFVDWIHSGGNFIAIHSGSTTFKDNPVFSEMLGGAFDHHGRQVATTLEAGDTQHPANGSIGNTWPIAQEEMYLIKNYKRDDVRSIWFMRRHPNQPEQLGFFPVAWVRQFGEGRVFYTSLGHRADLWSIDPAFPDRMNSVETAVRFRKHLLGGIRWVLGLEQGSAAPNRAALDTSATAARLPSTGVGYTDDLERPPKELDRQ